MLGKTMLVLEHGIGGSKDLPIPAELVIAGAMAALAVSFIILALAWRTPRFDGPLRGRAVPRWVGRLVDIPAAPNLLRGLGMLFFLYVAFAAVAGPDVVSNPVFGVVYVWLWVGMVPASLLFGPVFRAVSPVRTMHAVLCKAARREPDAGLLELRAWVGIWPAAVGLLAFVWMELVSPNATSLEVLRLWFAGYLALALVGAVLFGSCWLAAADPFEVYSTLVAHLAPLGRRPDGRLVWRSPLANLCRLSGTPGLTAVTAVLFGSTVFDSFKDSARWVQFAQQVDANRQLLNSTALAASCGIVGLSFVCATRTMGSASGMRRTRVPSQFAHTLVPIILGYLTAHYLSYLVVFGQITLTQLSDPLARGDDVLGTAHLPVGYWIVLHPFVLAQIKVVSVVGGHILGVVTAHDRALTVLPRRRQLTGQLPLLAVMVFFTVSGLLLLFGA